MASQWPPKKNAAFTLYFSLYKSDGTIIVNPGIYTKKVSIDGAVVADIVATVTEEDITYGQLSVVLSAAEMNGDGVWIYIKDDTAGCVPFTCTLYTAGSLLDDVKTETASIKTKTDFLPSATAGATGGVFIAGTNAATSVTTALTANLTGNVSGSVGSVTGAVGSVTGAVASVTGAVGSVTGNVGGNVTGSAGSVTGAVGSVTGNVGGNVTGSVGSIAAGGLTAASLDATVQARLGIVGNGTAQSATNTTLVVAAGTGSLYKPGSVIGVLGSTQGYYQWRSIVSVSTDTLTVDALDVTPTGTITYIAFAAAPASTTALPTVLLSPGTGTGQISLSAGAVLLQATQTGVTIPTVTTLTNAVASVTGAVGSVTGNVGGNVTGSVGSVATNGITAASLATDAGTEIADAVLDRAITEPSTVFAWGAASLRTVVQLLGAFTRNKQTQTATTFLLRNDADSATIATSTVSDDGTTTTRGELS